MSRIMKPFPGRLLLCLVVPLLAAAGCATKPDSATNLPPCPYMRVARPDDETIALQIAIRRFTPARGNGPVVWLSAASHLGDANYFASLQQHLQTQALVLFEGVKDETEKQDAIKTRIAAARRAAKKKSATETNASAPASLQSSMAESLGLLFQLEAIDYERSHFRNSDLSVQQIQRLMSGGGAGRPTAARGKSVRSRDNEEGNQEFGKLLDMMDGSSVMGAVLNLGLKIIGASPKLQALTRLVMIETLGQLRGDITQMKGLPPEMKELITVLIQERNKAVLADLKGALQQRTPPRSISIFYGAGHMDDMERRLRQDYQYTCQEERWLTAFAVNTRQSGLGTVEQDLIHTLVKGMMDLMQP